MQHIQKQFSNLVMNKRIQKKDTPCAYRVLHTEDTVRGHHRDGLSFKSVFSCTFLRDEGTKQQNYPKQGHYRSIGHKGGPSTIHRPSKELIGQQFSRSVKSGRFGAILSICLGSLSIGFQTLFPHFSLAEIHSPLSQGCFPSFNLSFSFVFKPPTTFDSRNPRHFEHFEPIGNCIRRHILDFRHLGFVSSELPLVFMPSSALRPFLPFFTTRG